MRLCIPTLCNYDGVDALIRSAEAGTVKPTGYVVLDNGGKYPRARLDAAIGERSVERELITPTDNLGVAASWNVFLDRFGKTEPLVISNDDITLGPTAFATLDNYGARGALRAGFGWALFMQRPECTQRVGFYDENFWPAYHEDIDYIIRMERRRVPDIRLEGHIDIQHAGWRTTLMLGNPDWLADGRARNHSYLVAKWGTESLTPETYQKPFNGSPPAGWDLRQRLPSLPLRWELLNEIAELIGAKRYLDLGLSDGACFRRVNVHEKFGVDKSSPLARELGDRGYQMTTDEFFAQQQSTARHSADRFDLIFIDADHSHVQVDRDIENALRLLTPEGVIVLHDCSPFYEDMQVVPHNGSHFWTGDVWRSIVRLRLEGRHAVRVVNSDFGLGVVIPNGQSPYHSVYLPSRTPSDLTYQDLVAERENLLGLISGWNWREWFTMAYAARKPTAVPSVCPTTRGTPYELPCAGSPCWRCSVPLPQRVNLGCSTRHIDGYINVDRVPPADLVADLSETWPWPTSALDEVRAFDVIEHLTDKIHTMNEAWRVLKPGGLLHIFVPTTDGRGAWQDPTHTSFWNRNSFWYYEDGNAHRELAESYGVLARFSVESEAVHDSGGGIWHIELRLRAVKDFPAEPPAEIPALAPSARPVRFEGIGSVGVRDELVVLLHTEFRPDTTGVHLLKALRELGIRVRHFDPCTVVDGKPVFRGYEKLDVSCARAILCIDDDIGWPLPPRLVFAGMPRYYWCIDCYRLDDPLWIGGTRRARLPEFDKVFYAQLAQAREHEYAVWLPLAVDVDLCTHTPRDTLYDWCFIGHLNERRTSFLAALSRAFPRCHVGTAFGEDADRIYNESRLAINLSNGGDLNMRSFEAQATSALLLSEHTDNGEAELFAYLPTFRSPEQCINLMSTFLDNPRLREHLASAQAADMRQAHTYTARAQALLTEIGWPRD